VKKQTDHREISKSLLAEIKHGLTANELIRYQLPEGGRLHIDRQLPFLIVHRRYVERSDIGTRRLLLGEAAYLQTTSSPRLQASVKALVHMIAHTQAQHYGAFLVIELWSKDRPEQETSDAQTGPRFKIIAPEHLAPYETLETLEHALADITLRGVPARVATSYHDQPAPPGLPPLFNAAEIATHPVIFFGLEVEAVYRQSQTNALLYFALKKLHHGMAVAFKKTFFTFSHNRTTFKPEHFHVLGRRTMTDAVWEVDRQIAGVSDNFDLLLHVTPINAHREWQVFENNHYQSMPEFHYRPRTADPAILKRKLYRAPIEQIEDPSLANMFASKRDELDKQISLMAARGQPDFLHGSMQLYGSAEEWLMQLAHTILSYPLDQGNQDDTLQINAEQLADYARAEVDYYQQTAPDLDCRVEVRDDIAGILVSHGHFLISSDAVISNKRLNATLNHEIGTHVLTHYNGRQQPFQQLHAGMAGYEELQEGLAVLSEYLVGELNPARLRLLAGRVVAAHSVMSGSDFQETFKLLNQDHHFSPYTAFEITLRVHRGGGFTKDMVYLRGFSHLLDYIKTHDEIDILYTGKVSLEFLPLIEELSWREVIKPATLKPRYLQHEAYKKRLKQLIEEPTIERILGGQ
jgi:uncharacterized protein (TIGR02421 family)